MKNGVSKYINHVIKHANSSVIRQKGESQNGYFKRTKHAKFFEKPLFFTPWYAHVRVRIRGVRNVILFSWSTRFEIRPFILLPTNFELYRAYTDKVIRKNWRLTTNIYTNETVWLFTHQQMCLQDSVL